jgi:hypothetical protein
MRELFIERKTAIEAIHFAGHTPLYIETEPEVRDLEARLAMDSLVDDADAFLSLFYLSEGDKQAALDDVTPIEYELARYLQTHSSKLVLMFRKTHEGANASQRMIHWFDRIARALPIRIHAFETPQDLHGCIRDVLRGKRYVKRADDTDLPFEFTIRYVGPDYIGLIGKLAEIVFTKYKLNVDYISHAAHGGHSTVCLSCSPRKLPGSAESLDDQQFEADLQLQIEADIEKAQTEDRWIPGTDPSFKPKVVVNRDSTGKRRRQFFVNVRTIDAPGQLNAVCKQLRDMRYNIDELQLHPTPPEYPRQTTMTLWLSRLDVNHGEVQKEIDRIEGALQYLVGVRALSIRVAFTGSTKTRARRHAVRKHKTKPVTS